MSTLASDYLALGPALPYFGKAHDNELLRKYQVWTHDFIRARLTAPLPGAKEDIVDHCAERFVFDADIPVVVKNLVRTKQVDAQVIQDSIEFPATNTWIEFPVQFNDDGDPAFTAIDRIGFMFGPVYINETILSTTKTMLAAVARSARTGYVRPVGLISLPPAPLRLRDMKQISCHWFLDDMKENPVAHHPEGSDQHLVMLFYDLCDCLFLINVPRVCEIRTGNFGPRKKSVQERTGKPFIEYRQVTLNVGIGAPRYKRSETDAQEDAREDHARRKLHRVISHFRTYREGREAPMVSFVPQHWRGDPEKGIILHERTVKVKA